MKQITRRWVCRSIVTLKTAPFGRTASNARLGHLSMNYGTSFGLGMKPPPSWGVAIGGNYLRIMGGGDVRYERRCQFQKADARTCGRRLYRLRQARPMACDRERLSLLDRMRGSNSEDKRTSGAHVKYADHFNEYLVG